MSKLLFGVALLALVGCGGSEQGALFDQARDLPQAGTLAAAGSGGAEQASGGAVVAQAGQQSGGGGAVGVTDGAVAGSAGSVTSGGSDGGTESGGSGGASAAGVAGQVSTGGGGSGGVAVGGLAGNAGSGGKAPTAGYPPIDCPKGGLDCDGIESNGCETSKQSHDHCGACDIKCDVTQTCLPGGEVGSGYCGTP